VRSSRCTPGDRVGLGGRPPARELPGPVESPEQLHSTFDERRRRTAAIPAQGETSCPSPAALPIASSSLPESTQHTSTEPNLRDADQLIAYRLERASRSLCRLLKTVDTMKAEHKRALMLDGQVSRGRTQCSDVHSKNTGERTSSGSRGALVLRTEPHPRQSALSVLSHDPAWQRDAIRRASTEVLTPAAMLSAKAWRRGSLRCLIERRAQRWARSNFACGLPQLERSAGRKFVAGGQENSRLRSRRDSGR
jgi:hypothetical protein